MPIVSEFYGIKILMYWNDYMPAHFHAEYGDHKIIVDSQQFCNKGDISIKTVKTGTCMV